MIAPAQNQNLQVKPRWQAPVGVMESVVAYNCRKYGMPVPVLVMPMWEGAGNRALDLSGQGNHGTIDGAEWVADGLDFVSANTDKVTTPLLIDPRKENTVIFKTVWTTLSQDNLHGCRNDGGDRFYIGIDGNYTFMGAGNTFHYDSTGITHGMSVGVPYLISLVVDGSTARYYVDDVEKDSFSYTASAAITNPFYIGDLGGTLGFPVNAKVEFMYVYSCTLSTAQIKFLCENPYFMYRLPEELYGYAAATGGVTIPVFLHHYNQLRGA